MHVESTARRYRQARLRVPLTVAELSRRSGVSERTIYRIEAGDWARCPLLENVSALADALGVEVTELLPDEEAA